MLFHVQVWLADVMLKSAQEFLWGLLKRWYYFALAVIIEFFDMVERVLSIFSDNPINLPPTLTATVLGVGFMFGAIHTYHALRMEKLDLYQRYENATSKRLDLVFGTAEPFEQVQERLDSNMSKGILRTYRVGVKNVGGTTINRVELDLEGISPSTEVKCPVPFHIMHDNPPAGTHFKTGFSLDAEQVEYVDVVAKQEWSVARGHPIHICHTVPNASNVIAQGRYQLVLFAHGEGAVPIKKTFVVDVDENERLVFRPA